EQGEGKHAEMLAWVKALIKIRRSNVCLNDGDMHHLLISTDDERRTLVMERDEARVLINIGEMSYTFALLEGETLELISREGLGVRDNHVDLPPMTLAVLMSTSEEVQNRRVAAHRR
ncbi:MAG: maltooligosyltrehalose trehalohydrolase, partial [Acidobacteriaceae bacterium]|nr:maltooligosyltrehalose trehalohydrolase [Acidobacteriaceae bacterium]